MNRKFPIRPDDALQATQAGTAQLQSSQTSLNAEQLELLVLLDGQTMVKDLAARLNRVKPQDVERLLGDLCELGLAAPAGKVESDSLDFTDFFNAKSSPSADALAAAGSEASSGVSTLQQQGYYVRIARSAAKKRTLAAGQRPSVIVVEDEIHLAKLLKTYMGLEGFEARTAANREEIVQALRTPPLPDLVLLDVMLPDADGFDILAAIRRHPALKAVPVIMLTAKSTREAVLKGLAGGADGYITKPFEVDVLMKAVKAVLGLPPG